MTDQHQHQQLQYFYHHHCCLLEVVYWDLKTAFICLVSALLIDSASKQRGTTLKKLQLSLRITMLGRILLSLSAGATNCQVNTHVIKLPINTRE